MLSSPYAGLMPFTEEQAPFFFGRDVEREIITANLMAARLTLLYGPSGVGKSSVLNAGVVHNLRQLGRAAAASGGKPEFAIVSFKTWRDDPIAALERTIEHEVHVIGRGAWFADRLQSCADEIDADILVILDQFEEFFLYHPVEEGDRSFAAEFARAVNRRDLRASFLVSMREDSIAKLDSFKGRISNLFENRLSIERLDRQQAKQSIVRPIEQYNRLLAAPGQSYTIEPELVEAVLDQVKANPGVRDDTGKGRVRNDIDSGIETPHLQLVMTRLWQEEVAAKSTVLRLETLRRLGGAGEIVRKHVDSALDALSRAERDAAATIFQYLVTPAGTKIALGVEDLYPNAGMSASDLRSLLVKLSSGESRILTSVAPAPDQPARERYQIFHDVLAEKVLDWRSRFVKAKEKAAAEAVAEEERRKAEKEARAATRLRRLLVLVAALFVVAAIAAWVAWRQTEKANAGRLAAEQSSAEAEAAKHNANASKLDVLAANAKNAALEAEKEKFQLSAQEAEARLAGKTEQANKLKEQVVAANSRVATELQKRDSLAAQAQKERVAEQYSIAQAEQLKTQVQATRSVDTAPATAATTPPKPETTVPPASPPADTGRPSAPPVAVAKPPVSGDYRETYRKAIDAKNRKRWDDAARLFQTAVEQNGTDTGERINISGFGNIEPYVPKYYLGLSLKNLGRCAEAVQAFDDSERDGAVEKTTLYKSLQQYRQECQKKH